MLQLLGRKLTFAVLLLLAFGQDAPKPPDKHVGAAMFKVVKTTREGRNVYLEPLMVPTIEASRLTGDKILDTTIVKCDVYERFLDTDMKDDTIIGITVLKCDGQEYGVGGIDFVLADK